MTLNKHEAPDLQSTISTVLADFQDDYQGLLASRKQLSREFKKELHTALTKRGYLPSGYKDEGGVYTVEDWRWSTQYPNALVGDHYVRFRRDTTLVDLLLVPGNPKTQNYFSYYELDFEQYDRQRVANPVFNNTTEAIGTAAFFAGLATEVGAIAAPFVMYGKEIGAALLVGQIGALIGVDGFSRWRNRHGSLAGTVGYYVYKPLEFIAEKAGDRNNTAMLKKREKNDLHALEFALLPVNGF